MIYIVVGVDGDGAACWDLFDTPVAARTAAMEYASFCTEWPKIVDLAADWTKPTGRVEFNDRLLAEAQAAYALQEEFGE